uniref:sn-1-specific diacylglycerol lipase n=1 Tax=Setaria digitata TaxID=48799 RepID=A0A915PX22_9BILA
MPSLVALGRRWNIASDDFVFPSLSEVLVRLAWILITCLVFMLKKWESCTNQHILINLFSLIGINGLTILICIVLALVSARGSILEPHKRQFVAKIMYIRLPLFICEIAIATASTIFAFRSLASCNLIVILRLTTVLQWALIITVLVSIAVVFNPSGGSHMRPSFRRQNKVWMLRFNLFLLRKNEAMRAALQDIAILTTSFFADVDLVASDILAGLLLLVHAPHQPPSVTTYVPEVEPPDWMTLENARYMAKYIAAIYGWEIYMFYNCSCCDWLKICKRIKCCGKCCNRQSFPNRGDNCCMCAIATFLTVTGCKETDIIFVSFANELYQVPFIVLLDIKTKSVVITIRGTASMMDAINDLSLDDEAFSVDVDQDPILRQDEKLDTPNEELRVHRGMLRSARYVLEILRANRVLEGLKLRYPSYTIVCCGHSLGAGVATLLTLLLRQSFGPIRCFAYSPPGCVISENGLKETQKFVFSVYIGDDIVPRLSFQTVCKLKYDVIKSLACSNSPKYKVLLRGFYRLCFSSPWEPDQIHEEDGAVNINDRLPLVFHTSLMIIDDGADSTNDENPAERWARKRTKLLPPGCLLHVWVTDKKKKTICKRWTHHSSLNEIKLSSAVIRDHMPYNVLKVLNMELDLDV